ESEPNGPEIANATPATAQPNRHAKPNRPDAPTNSLSGVAVGDGTESRESSGFSGPSVSEPRTQAAGGTTCRPTAAIAHPLAQAVQSGRILTFFPCCKTFWYF